MAISRPFAYNPSLVSISGATQVGSLAIATSSMALGNTSVKWWNGPDESLGHVIAVPVSTNKQSTPVTGVSASVGFYRTNGLIDSKFITLAQSIAFRNGTPQVFSTGDLAKTWLNTNGFWTSYPSYYKNAYEIKQANPSAISGFYTISNPSINSGTPFQIYADMTTDGGGWTLIMTNSNTNGWTYANAISLNTGSASITTNYSIIGYADALKRSSSGFQYMIDAQTRGSWCGIWTANGTYSFVSSSNLNTNITLNTKFGTWVYADDGVEERMPWYSNASGYITTSILAGGGSWWGTLISSGGWSPAPWMSNSGMPNPGIIWYWVR